MWRKRKWLCTNVLCKRRSFTESTPAIPARARMTMRVKSEMASAVLGDDRSVAAVAGAYGCTRNTCQNAVATIADPLLATESEPVTIGLGVGIATGALPS
jgi:transposase